MASPSALPVATGLLIIVLEVNKPNGPGTHTRGIAADIAVSDGFQRMNIVHEALKMGVFTGIGVHKDFIHLDMREGTPVMWTYYS